MRHSGGSRSPPFESRVNKGKVRNGPIEGGRPGGHGCHTLVELSLDFIGSVVQKFLQCLNQGRRPGRVKVPGDVAGHVANEVSIRGEDGFPMVHRLKRCGGKTFHEAREDDRVHLGIEVRQFVGPQRTGGVREPPQRLSLGAELSFIQGQEKSNRDVRMCVFPSCQRLAEETEVFVRVGSGWIAQNDGLSGTPI